MNKFSDDQKSRLVATFAEVDALLMRATHYLDPVALRSPFSPHHADVTPTQHHLIAQKARSVRTAMQAILARHQITLPRPIQSAAQVCRSAINQAVIAIEGLGPGYVSDHGPVSDEIEAELNRIVSELIDMVLAMENHLSPRMDIDVFDRLARLDQRRPAVRSLMELGRSVDAHHLTHLRIPLEALVDRLEADDFEIAVFGRVNAGKSSLVNCLLELDVLPTGALPMTAVPVFVTYGVKPSGRAEFADAIDDVFELGRLAEFAAEQFNPANDAHVTRLRIEIPAPRLKDGITLVDMPGIGFNAEAEALSSGMPRCDLGIVLIDATGSLAMEDAVVVEALRAAGSTVMVLLAKADRLAFDDRWKIYGYVCRELQSRTGANCPVYLVSTTGDDPVLCNDWITRGLDSCLQQRRRLKDVSIDAKIGALRNAVNEVLTRERAPAAQALRPLEIPAATESVIERVHAMLDAALSRRSMAEAESVKQATALIDEVAHNGAVLWQSGAGAPSIDIATLVSASLEARAGGVALVCVSGPLVGSRSLAQRANALSALRLDRQCVAAIFRTVGSMARGASGRPTAKLHRRKSRVVSTRRRRRRIAGITARQRKTGQDSAPWHFRGMSVGTTQESTRSSTNLTTGCWRI